MAQIAFEQLSMHETTADVFCLLLGVTGHVFSEVRQAVLFLSVKPNGRPKRTVRDIFFSSLSL